MYKVGRDLCAVHSSLGASFPMQSIPYWFKNIKFKQKLLGVAYNIYNLSPGDQRVHTCIHTYDRYVKNLCK